MPKMKFGSASVKPEATGFETYDGPEPKPGVYNGVIKSMELKESKSSDAIYFNMLVEFEDNIDDAESGRLKAKFNGYPLWDMIVPGDSEIQQIRVAQLMNAICGRNVADVDHEEFKNGRAKIKSVGGKNPIGVKVKISTQRETDNRDAEAFRTRLRDIFPRKVEGAILEAAAGGTIDDGGTVEAVEPDADETPDLDALREQLSGLKLLDLKKLAKETYEFTDVDLKGKKAPAIVDEIIALYAEEDPEEDPEEEAESDEDGADDGREARATELTGMKLPALKKLAKEDHDATLADLKGLDVSGVADWILEKEFGAASEEGDDDGDGGPVTGEDGLVTYESAEQQPREWLVEQLVEAGYDADDFDDEEEYDTSALTDLLVDEGVVAGASATPF